MDDQLDCNPVGVSSHDAQAMTNYFYQVIYEDLKGQGFQMVTSPEPDTLRVQVSLTVSAASFCRHPTSVPGARWRT